MKQDVIYTSNELDQLVSRGSWWRKKYLKGFKKIYSPCFVSVCRENKIEWICCINLYKNITIVTIISVNTFKWSEHTSIAHMEDIVTSCKIHHSQPEGSKEEGPI